MFTVFQLRAPVKSKLSQIIAYSKRKEAEDSQSEQREINA